MIDRLGRPARLLAIVGVSFVAVAAFLPWESYLDTAGFSHDRGGFDGAADGFTAILFGACLLATVTMQGVRSSRIRIVQLLPAILGLACLFIALDGLQASRAFLQEGNSGTLDPGVWLFACSALVAAVGGLLTTLIAVRSNPPLPQVNPEPLVEREFLVHVLVAVVGFVVGLYAGVRIAQGNAGPPGAESASVTIFAALLGGFAGTGLASFAWRHLRPSPAQGRRDEDLGRPPRRG